MRVLSTKQYEEYIEAKNSGNTELAQSILDGTDVIDVEIESELDLDTVENEKAAGLSLKEIATKYDVSVQKINAIVKKGSK